MFGLKSKVLITLLMTLVFSRTLFAAPITENTAALVLPKGYPRPIGNAGDAIWTESTYTPSGYNAIYSLWDPVTGELKKLGIPKEFSWTTAARSAAGLFFVGGDVHNPLQMILFMPSEGKAISTDLPVGQSSSRLIVLADQSALVVGGELGSPRRFTREVQRVVVTDGGLKVERMADVPLEVSHGYSVVALDDGRAMLLGGENDESVGCGRCVADTFILDPKTKTWDKGPRMLEPRSGARATVLPDGSVLVVGGWTPEHGWSNVEASRSTERWMPKENRFVSDGPLPFGVAQHQITWAAGQQGRHLLLMGGLRRGWTGNFDILDYDVATGIWQTVGLNTPVIVNHETGDILAGSFVLNKQTLLWVYNSLKPDANTGVVLDAPAQVNAPFNPQVRNNAGVALSLGAKSPSSYHSNISTEFLLSEVSSPGRIGNAVWWISQGADVNARNKEGSTLLMLANQYWDIKSIQFLIDSGADINAKNKAGATDLMLAIQSGRIDVVRVLLSKDVDINAKNANGKTALVIALELDKLDAAQMLLEKGPDINTQANDGTTALTVASLKGHLDIVQALLAKGADVNATKIDGNTALMSATERGQVEVVQELLAQGADVDAKMKNGRNALMLASENNHPDVVQIFKEHRAKPNVKRNDHMINPLHASRAELNAQDATGVTMLMQAAEQDKLDVVQKLLDQGADVNLKAYNGRTALMFASRGSHLDIMQALLDRNANINAKDNEGKAAIDMISKGSLAARNLLIKAGAVSATKNANWKGVWKGNLGKQEVTACFQLDEDNLFQLGVYYYSKHRQPIKLELDRDIIQAQSGLMLRETNGAWNLTMSDNDTLTGTWSYQGKQYPLHLVRVDVANQDEVGEPCGSREFNDGRKIKPEYVATKGTVNGTPYRIVADKNTRGVAGFELIGTDKITASINQQLRKDLDTKMDEAFECTTGVLGRFGENGDYSSTTSPLFITKHWLSVSTSIDESCGGAHPNTDTRFQLWDLETGKVDDIWTWFNEKGAQKQNGFFMPGPALAKVLASRWPKNADGGADHECDDAEGMASWNIHPDAAGLIFSAELPHVIQACAEDVHIPYKALLPMLNLNGKVAAASIMADFAKQQIQGH